MKEGASVVGRAVDAQEGAVGAENERLRAHDGDKAMIAEARLRKYVLARIGKDYGWREECGRCGMHVTSWARRGMVGGHGGVERDSVDRCIRGGYR